MAGAGAIREPGRRLDEDHLCAVLGQHHSRDRPHAVVGIADELGDLLAITLAVCPGQGEQCITADVRLGVLEELVDEMVGDDDRSLTVEEIAEIGRNTQGVTIFRTGADETVVSVERIGDIGEGEDQE